MCYWIKVYNIFSYNRKKVYQSLKITNDWQMISPNDSEISRESLFSLAMFQSSPYPREVASFVDSIAIIFISGARIEARAALPRDGSRESSSCWSRVVACALLFSPLARVSRRGLARRVVPGHRVQVCSRWAKCPLPCARASVRSSLARRAPSPPPRPGRR